MVELRKAEEVREQIARALYDAWPHTVISKALADLTGLPVGEVLTWEVATAHGADMSGLYRYADAVAPLIRQAQLCERASAGEQLCEDCPPVGYPTDKTRCTPCPRRATTAEARLAEMEGEREKLVQFVRRVADTPSTGPMIIFREQARALLATIDKGEEGEAWLCSYCGRPYPEKRAPDFVLKCSCGNPFRSTIDKEEG